MTNSNSCYLHGYHPSVLRSHGNRDIANSAAYLEAELCPGRSLLDVGAGIGTITADFARRLKPGRVTAIEPSAEALAITRATITARQASNVDLAVGDAMSLPFADDCFDIVHAHQLLQHLADPVQALREMRRVCRPGGVVAARDCDYAGIIWYPRLPALDLWLRLYEQAARARGGEPDAGRHLLHWAREAGFAQVTATSSTWCMATPEARQWWGGMWAERIRHSAIATQLQESGMATMADLRLISAAWQEWAAAPDGWLSIPHGEILCHP